MVALDAAGSPPALRLVKTTPKDGFTEARIDIVLGGVLDMLDECEPTVVAIEEYAFSRHSRAMTPLHELGGVVKHYLFHDQRLFITVPSTKVKKHATGRGNAKKPEMIAAACTAGFETSNDNLADAYWIARWCLDCWDDLFDEQEAMDKSI